MKCDDCSNDRSEMRVVLRNRAFIPKAAIDIKDKRYARILGRTMAKIPSSGLPIDSIAIIRLRKKGTLPGLVGLTTYKLDERYQAGSPKASPDHRNTVTFYTGLLGQLSDEAIEAVMAHELAHAWLNEHVGPEASKQREEDADILAEMWGFGPQLHALANETEPIS